MKSQYQTLFIFALMVGLSFLSSRSKTICSSCYSNDQIIHLALFWQTQNNATLLYSAIVAE
jgi:uncharacterized membrane protein